MKGQPKGHMKAIAHTHSACAKGEAPTANGKGGKPETPTTPYEL
jgi:hypothetical protein